MPNGDAGGRAPGLLSWRVWVGALLLAFAAWLLITYSGIIGSTFALVFGAFLISVSMRPAVDYLSRWKVPRWLTVLAIYLVILTLLGLLSSWIGSTINRQITEVSNNAPRLLRQASDTVTSLLERVPWLSDVVPPLDTLTQNITRALQQVAGTVFGAATGAGRFVLELLIVVALSFIFTVDKNLGASFLGWFPARYRDRIGSVVLNASHRLERWVVAQLGIILYFTVTYGIGLAIIGVPFALLIAVVGGLMELIPFIGGVIALLLSVIAALTANPVMVLWVLLLYVIVTQVEANIVQPQFYGHAVDVHPALVIIALFVGSAVGGIFGALFAVPVVVVLMAILKEFRPSDGQEEATIEDPPPDSHELADTI